MVPSAIVLGLVLGALIRDRRSFVQAVVIGVVASAAFGVLVGYAGGSVLIGLAGTALGLANLAAGAAVGTAGRAAVRLAAGR
jgi:hypothetical protein